MRGKLASGTALFFGALAVLAIPGGAAAAQYLSSVTLLESLYASVPAAAVLGLIAVAASRRARFVRARSVFQGRGRIVRLGRFLAWTGLYLSFTGGIALAVYGALRAAH